MASQAPYVAIPSTLQLDPRVLGLSDPEAELLLIRIWLYCGAQLTDGLIPKTAHKVIGMGLGRPVGQLLAELVAAGLVEVPSKGSHAGEHVLLDYHSVNPTAAQWTKRRDAQRKNAMKRWSDKKPKAADEVPVGDPNGTPVGTTDPGADGNAPTYPPTYPPHITELDEPEVGAFASGDRDEVVAASSLQGDAQSPFPADQKRQVIKAIRRQDERMYVGASPS